MKNLTILLISLASSGCVFTSKELTPNCPNYPESKLILDDLPPIDRNVHITIEPGKTQADDGGKKLIRAYVDAQKRIWRWRRSQP